LNVAKKNTNGSDAATPRRATTRRTTKTEQPAVFDTAADMGGGNTAAAAQPSYDDIAQAAYQRYLSRGGHDGADFDDWIEAERELTKRNAG
jgi:hypothetical protein